MRRFTLQLDFAWVTDQREDLGEVMRRHCLCGALPYHTCLDNPEDLDIVYVSGKQSSLIFHEYR